MNTNIEIRTSTDWDRMRQEGLKVVVDPMVFRTADVFLRGASGLARSSEPKHPETMWSVKS